MLKTCRKNSRVFGHFVSECFKRFKSADLLRWSMRNDTPPGAWDKYNAGHRRGLTNTNHGKTMPPEGCVASFFCLSKTKKNTSPWATKPFDFETSRIFASADTFGLPAR